MRMRYVIIMVCCLASHIYAGGPLERNVGVGIITGDPLGATVKRWLSNERALVLNVGADYYGSPRIGIDYQIIFRPLALPWTQFYAGPGIAVGFAHGKEYLLYGAHGTDQWVYRPNGGPGLGIRGIVGLNVIPAKSPFEFFLEFGSLMGVVPDFGVGYDIGVGARYYP
jgi:hypothetical protein